MVNNGKSVIIKIILIKIGLFSNNLSKIITGNL